MGKSACMERAESYNKERNRKQLSTVSRQLERPRLIWEDWGVGEIGVQRNEAAENRNRRRNVYVSRVRLKSRYFL